MYLTPKMVEKVSEQCYGKRLSRKVAARISKQTSKAVEDLELVIQESRDELAEPAFFFSPELGD